MIILVILLFISVIFIIFVIAYKFFYCPDNFTTCPNDNQSLCGPDEVCMLFSEYISKCGPKGNFNMLFGTPIGNYNKGFFFQWTNNGTGYVYYVPTFSQCTYNPSSLEDPTNTLFDGKPVLQYRSNSYILNLNQKMALTGGSTKRPRIELKPNDTDDTQRVAYNDLKNYRFQGEFKMTTSTKFGSCEDSNTTHQAVAIFQIFGTRLPFLEILITYKDYLKPKCSDWTQDNPATCCNPDDNYGSVVEYPCLIANFDTIQSDANGIQQYTILSAPSATFENGNESFTVDVQVTEDDIFKITTVVEGNTCMLEIPLADVASSSETYYFKQGVYGQIPYGGYSDITTFECTEICSLEVFKSEITYTS